MADVVRDYLKSRDYADPVILGGLEGLVRRWESVAESVAAGNAQEWSDYLNDMDGRRILEEAMAIAPAEERALWIERVQTADKKIRPHLKPTKDCLCYSREHHWWYYHEPIGGLF